MKEQKVDKAVQPVRQACPLKRSESSSMKDRAVKWAVRKRNLRRLLMATASVLAILFPESALPTTLIAFALLSVVD